MQTLSWWVWRCLSSGEMLMLRAQGPHSEQGESRESFLLPAF